MIYIERYEEKVRVKIDTGLNTTSGQIWLYWNCNSEMYAELLSRHINKRLDETIQAIRKEEYERGWKDAKAKKSKANWFSAVIRKIHAL